MTAGTSEPIEVLEPGSRGRRAGDRYSRRVALLKRVLPIAGAALLALVAAWPRLGPLLDSVRLGFPMIDLREAHELRMLNPRYAGVDRLNRPFVVTSAIGRQVPNRDDLMSLESPRAEMTMHSGAVVVLTAATAMYQAQAQLLDLFGDVNLVHQNGTRFVTKTAHIDVAAETAEGHDPITGNGPSGDIAAQGFRIADKGDTIIFTGNSHLVLKGGKANASPAMKPPALPAEIEETAARIEAAAMQPAAMVSQPARPVADPAPAAPDAKSRSPEIRDGKVPARNAAPASRQKRDAS